MFSIADVLTLHLIGGRKDMDMSDTMRVQIFCHECENLSNGLDDSTEHSFVKGFLEGIVKTTGYLTFSNFCDVDEKALVDIAIRCFKVVELNNSKK